MILEYFYVSLVGKKKDGEEISYFCCSNADSIKFNKIDNNIFQLLRFQYETEC